MYFRARITIFADMQCLKNVSAASLSLRKLLEDMLKIRDETNLKKKKDVDTEKGVVTQIHRQ